MNIEVKQKMDEDYYKEYYSQFLRYKIKLKDVLIYLAIGIVVIVYAGKSNIFATSVGISAFFVWIILVAYFSRRRWLKDRLNSKLNNIESTLVFKDEEVYSYFELAKSHIKWEFFKDTFQTSKGLFINQENGLSLYLPKKSFENQEDIQTIIEKVKEVNTSSK